MICVKRSEFTFKYGPINLKIVPEYKYLGVIVDEHLTFSQCSKTLADSAGRALSAIISKFKEFKDNGYHTFNCLYDSGVLPVMYYGCSVWGFKTINNHSDLVQNKAMCYFLGVNKFTPIAALQGEMGWHPSIYGKYLCMLRLWNRLIKLPNDRLTKRIFNVHYERFSVNKN